MLETNTSPLTYCTIRVSRVLPLMNKPLSLTLLLFVFQSLQAFEPTEDGIYAVFDTSLGEFTAKIAYDAVPLTAANFVGLAEGKIPQFSGETGEPVSADPYYDGMIFHRVVEDFIIQSGDPEPDNESLNGPGYRIPDEMHPGLTHNIPYVIAMANNYCFSCEEAGEFFGIGENTGGSQFYITVEPAENSAGPSYLDGHFTIFGVVEHGTDIVEAISDVEVDELGRPLEDLVINAVSIIRSGAEAEAWDIRDYEIPATKPAEKPVSLSTDTLGLKFSMPTEAGDKLLLRKSEDLANWTHQLLLIDENDTLEVELAEQEKLFIDLQKITDPVNYSERIPNAVFTADIFNHPFGALETVTWTFNFNDNLDDIENENRFGLVSVPGIPDAVILEYEYHRLPNGARFRMVTQSQQVMTFYLRFTEGSSGNYYAWVDDYFHGTEITQPPYLIPLRFPITGAFELNVP